MAPSKGKKSEPDENDWQTIIAEAPLDEENWKVKVILIESAGGEQERMYLNNFEIYAAQEKRFVIKNICKTETIFMINQLGAEKKVKDPNLRVFEECQSYLADKKDIPPDILALVIKHLILKMKDEYLFISQQRLEVKQGMQRESATMLDKTEVRGTVASARKDEPPPPPPPVKGKGKGDGEPVVVPQSSEGKKFNTQLRMRGEEWRDKVYVDDYPLDGPNLYVAVTGFMEPYLPGSLVKVGIPLTAVVQIRIDPTKIRVPSSLLKPTKRGQSLTELLAEKSIKFWDDIQLLRIQDNSADDFKGTAFIVFSPPYWNKDDLSGRPDKIYDELCFLMYDIQDLSRQHLHYKENMSIIDVPEDDSNQHFNELYKQIIDDLPLECVTIYSILDSILQTACNPCLDDDEINGSSVTSVSTSASTPKSKIEESKLDNAVNLVKQIFTTLCNTEADKKKYRLTYGVEYEESREPIIIRYGDFAKYNTFHLGNINLDNVVLTSLIGMPINNLWRSQPRPSKELEAKINFHVNVLLSCFERSDIETAELNRLINILACRKLYSNRSSLKQRHLPASSISEFKKKYLKRSVLAEPLLKRPSFVPSEPLLSSSFPSMTKSENEYECAFSHPETDPETQRIKLLFECPDISQLVTAAEIENNQPARHNMIDDYDFFEDLSGICAHQILREAFNNFNCVDYKYCEVTDCIILMFFNSHDNERIAREEWRSHLITPLCLQDFFDFIMDEQYEWIQNEEKIYDDNLLMEARSMSKDVVDPHALKSCIEATDVEIDLLMEGSLKYAEYVKVDEAITDTTEFTDSFTTKLQLSADMDSKVTKKKTTSPRKPAAKYHKQSINTEREYQSVEIPAKPFLGYDLGDRRVEVFGKDATFFSRDGTKVTSMYTLIIPINLEYIILSVLPGNSYNEFWVHKALGDHVTPEIRDTCESFRITSKDQVLIYIKKQKYEVTLQSNSNADIVVSPDKADTSGVIENEPSKIKETKYFHSLYVSWPNGMITETVYDDNSPVISHIKQYHTCQMPHLDEEMRFISLNGEVIIFKPSDDIEVLKPDGTLIKINKYYKRVVPIISAEPEVEPRAEIEKKNKKLKKKTSKVVEPVEDTTNLPPPEYEVIVNDFVLIEPNGHRQKWIDDVPFSLEKLLVKTTDYCLGEVFSRRMDGTHMLMNKDGLYCVTFPDKTRIVTSYVIDDVEIYPEWTDTEMEYLDISEPDTIEVPKSKSLESQKSNVSCASSISKKIEEEEVKEKKRTDGYVLIHLLFTIEHPNLSTITINNVNGTISVESPNETMVTVDKNNNYKINLDNETSATFDGENLFISYEACSECCAFTNCNITIMNNEESSLNANVEQMWLKMTDSFNTQVVVNEEGDIRLSDEPSSSDEIHAKNMSMNMEYDNKRTNDTEVKEPDVKSESFLVSHDKSKDMYLAKNIRFFILRRDLNCAELIHRALVEEHKRACRWLPWCLLNQYDIFGDHRKLASILTPIPLTEPEKWLMESKQSNKPKFKTYKDVKPYTGKGFYHWMRPYERFTPQHHKPDNILPERLPKAYILRILEREWDGENRKEFRGARELIQAVLRYRCIMEADRETIMNIPIIDMRTEDERRIDDIIQALAHKIYRDLKLHIAEDIPSRAKLTITTQPLLKPEEMSVEGEYVDEETDDAKWLEEERESMMKEAESSKEMRPALKRYWRRRAEEYKEEQFYKYLLREGSVPPYFRNVLGGAIWWDVNNATADAVTLAERRKMKCVCTDSEAKKFSENTTTAKPYM